MNCSVIILAWQDSEMTMQCIASMGDQPEIIVVDNGSDIAYAEALRDACQAPNRTYVRCPENLGFAGGMNMGLARATRDVVIFSNNDVIASEEVLEKLVDACLRPGVGAAFPAVADLDGRDHAATGRFLTLGQSLGMALGLNLIPRSPFGLESRVEGADWITGPFVAMRRLLAISLGGIPTHSFFYSEDYRLCWELRKRSLNCIVVKGASIRHARDASAQKVWNDNEIAEKQTYELLRAAMDCQDSPLRRRLLGRSFVFSTWWRRKLRPSSRRQAIYEGATRAYEEYGVMRVS